MHETIKAVRLEHIREAESESRKLFTLSNAEITCAFHESFPEYHFCGRGRIARRSTLLAARCSFSAGLSAKGPVRGFGFTATRNCDWPVRSRTAGRTSTSAEDPAR